MPTQNKGEFVRNLGWTFSIFLNTFNTHEVSPGAVINSMQQTQ
jgi:hypothetical protein